MLWKPHLTVAAIAERDGAFLMVEEDIDGRLVLNQPAGHLDDAESLLEAVRRETLEETAWHFRPEAITGCYRWRNPVNEETFVRVVFCGTCIEHEPTRILDQGIRRTLWMRYSEIEAASGALRSPLVLQCLKDYLSGTRFPLTMIRDIP